MAAEASDTLTRGSTNNLAAMAVEALPVTDAKGCHARECALPASVACESCARLCCEDHVRRITIERREEPVEIRGSRGALGRVPTRTETYALCPRCSTKPIPTRPPQRAAVSS